MLLAFSAFAQPRERMERIRSVKIDFIGKRLNLTPQQSSRFWPMYERYEDDLRGVRREFRTKYPEKYGSRNEGESRHFIDDNFEYQEIRLKLQKKYKNEFLRVLTPRQLADLYQAERDFKRVLIQHLRENRGKGSKGSRGAPPARRR